MFIVELLLTKLELKFLFSLGQSENAVLSTYFIEAGKKAGMTVCAVDDEFSRHLDAEKKLLADYFIHDYSDIKNHTFEYCGC